MSPSITIHQADGGIVYVHSTTVVLESHAATPAPPVAMSATSVSAATASPPQVTPDVAGIQRVTGFIRRAADVLRARIHRATAA